MSFGFIITRYVNSENTNKYWNQNVKLLRYHYPHCKIVIIDDNSDNKFLKADFEYNNLEILQSEYPKRGELLPYIYYLRHKWFDNAVIIHDSVFFHKIIDFASLNVPVASLWNFINNDSEISNILRISNSLNHCNLIQQLVLQWDKNLWQSCFGAQCFINHEFLVNLNNKYNFTNLIEVITNRSDRCALERIMGILFYIETTQNTILFGNINKFCSNCDYTFDEYIDSFNKNKVKTSIIKVWTGR